ncbi:hypothetical protein C1645_818476 [Glomus cerebriforme]|uniref:Uncharacterized protein n=1 Tax=Glomus cerebriforme TaxID=658196 RepID=A0A397TB60_9GLOM|nr:hypothetical protein C1645_818476 [Glomus cerebriforme]
MPKVKIAKKNPRPSLSKEITEYPKTNNILYTDGKQSYYYIIKQEGLYPQPPVLAYAQGKYNYKIPDYYCVETTWGRANNKRTVRCFINYIKRKPLFKIMYGVNFSEEVQSNMSSTAVANAVLKKLFPNNEKSQISGVHLFGIHLEILKQSRELKLSNPVNQSKPLKPPKPLELCSKTTVNRRQHEFGEKLKQNMQIEGTIIYGENQVNFKQVSYSVKNMDFQINYGSNNDKEKEEKLISIVQVVDQNYISREGYQVLASIESNLEREWAVSDQRIKITRNMNEQIPITLINIPTIPTQSELDFFDPEITEIVQKIKNGGYRSAKDILTYIVPVLILNGVLDINDPIIHLRISGDGRNVGRKIKHVMVTMAILNDENNIYKPDYHYTTVLYPGIEKYEILEIMMAPLIQELDELKNNGLIINGIIWNFELYFSSDWKFLAICLGFNAPNSKFFCPWCQISKCHQANNQINWKIDKKMEKINEYPGHNKRPLFPMIPLDKWIPDELHIMLRIWDRLWNLVIAELKEYDQFDNVCRDEIIQEMSRIGVNFHFWQEHGANVWSHTSLMGDDKLNVLKNFDLNRIFPPSRATKIRELWNRFHQIYFNIKSKNYDPELFKFEAENWLELFLAPGLYRISEITPIYTKEESPTSYAIFPTDAKRWR